MMNDRSPQIGDWVSFHPANDQGFLFGFIVSKISGSQNYVVFVPATKRQYYGSISSFMVEEPELYNQDILALIDVALDLKDENWFKELTDGLKTF